MKRVKIRRVMSEGTEISTLLTPTFSPRREGEGHQQSHPGVLSLVKNSEGARREVGAHRTTNTVSREIDSELFEKSLFEMDMPGNPEDRGPTCSVQPFPS